MVHLFRPGAARPVCGAWVAPGQEPTTTVLFKDLCKQCIGWRFLRSHEIRRENP